MKKKIVRLTEEDLEKLVRKIIKEDEEEMTQDPDQLDLFTGETTEVSEKTKELDDIKNRIAEEIYDLNLSYLDDLAWDSVVDNGLQDYDNAVQELEDWIYDNDFEGELMSEANSLLELFQSAPPIELKLTLNPEIVKFIKAWDE